MHEYALAEAVVRAALGVARAEGLARLTRVVVRVGELQQIQRETFAFALAEVRPADEALLEGTRFEVEPTPARLHCRACGHDFGLSETGTREADAAEAIHFVPELAHAFVRCPACSSPDFDLVEGRGVEIGALEGERP